MSNTSFVGLRRRHLLGAMAALPAAGAVPAAWAQQAAQAGTPPREVRVGFQKGSALLVLVKKQEVIAKRLKALGVSRVK